MRRLKILAPLLAVAVFCALGVHADTQDAARQLEQDLIAAAQAAGVSVDTTHMLSVLRPDWSFVGAVVSGLERIPATALPGGVDYGFAYICSPDLPAGYYTLRAFADRVQLGRIEGRVQFIDGAGNVAGELPASIQVFSLTVPSNPPFASTIVGGQLNLDVNSGYLVYSPWYICPNGWLICFGHLVVKVFDPA